MTYQPLIKKKIQQSLQFFNQFTLGVDTVRYENRLRRTHQVHE